MKTSDRIAQLESDLRDSEAGRIEVVELNLGLRRQVSALERRILELESRLAKARNDYTSAVIWYRGTISSLCSALNRRT